jgi:hypothetical protein
MFRSSTILRELVQTAQQTAYTPFHDMLPNLHAIYNDVILLNVLTEVYL